MPSTSYGSVPFAEQIAFFRRKLNIPTNHWTDIYSREHDWAFVVAGANRDDLLADIQDAVDKAIAEGGTLEQFRQDFDRIVEQYGWDYNGGRNWRSRTIYDTNLMSSYHAGRYEQLTSMQDVLPYWRYRHAGDIVEEPREEHQKWDGMILLSTDPWWHYYYPPNDWGCHCWVEGLTQDDLYALGKTGPDTAPTVTMQEHVIGKRNPNGPITVSVPEGIGPGFEHAPGRSRLQSAIPPELPDPPISGSTGGAGLPNTRPSEPLPPVRPAPVGTLPADLSDADYATAFLREFGATIQQPAIFKDVLGSALVMGAELFVTRATGALKANKRGRGQYLPIMATAIKSPDEIWVRAEYNHAQERVVIRRRYIARYTIPGQSVPALAVFEYGKSGWSGITTFNPDVNIDDLRIGVRVYRRSE